MSSLLWLFVVMVVSAANQTAGAAVLQDDSRFREFSNDRSPTPNELLSHLSRLPRVTLPQPNSPRLPMDNEFQDWIKNELLPSLSPEERNELAELAQKVWKNRLADQTPNGLEHKDGRSPLQPNTSDPGRSPTDPQGNPSREQTDPDSGESSQTTAPQTPPTAGETNGRPGNNSRPEASGSRGENQIEPGTSNGNQNRPQPTTGNDGQGTPDNDANEDLRGPLQGESLQDMINRLTREENGQADGSPSRRENGSESSGSNRPSTGQDQSENFGSSQNAPPQVNPGSAPDGWSSEDSRRAISEFRDRLAANPELERKLRQHLLSRPDIAPLRDLLNRQTTDNFQNGQFTGGAENSSNGGMNPGVGGSPQRNGFENGFNNGSVNPSESAGDSSASHGSTGSQQSGEHSGLGDAQSSQGSPFPNRPENRGNLDTDGNPLDQNGAGNSRSNERSNSHSDSASPFDRDRQASPQRNSPNGNFNNGTSNRPGIDGQGNSFSGQPRNALEQGSNSGNRSSSSVTEPGDDPTPRPSNSRGKGTGSRRSSSGQSPAEEEAEEAHPLRRAGENETFRDRINRILMEAAETAGKEEATGGSRGDGSNSSSKMLQGMMSSVVSGLQERMNDPGTKRNLQDAFRKSQQRMNDLREAAPSTGGISPSQTRSGLGLLGILAGIVVVAITAIALFSSPKVRQHFDRIMTRYAPRLQTRREYQVGLLESPRDLVDSVDRFVVWRFGFTAHWWHAGEVKSKLQEAYPGDTQTIDQIMDLYEQARYTKRELSISAESRQRIHAKLDLWRSDYLRLQAEARLNRTAVA